MWRRSRTAFSFVVPLLSRSMFTVVRSTTPTRNSVGGLNHKIDAQVFADKRETHHAKRAVVSVPSHCSVCNPVLSSWSMLQVWVNETCWWGLHSSLKWWYARHGCLQRWSYVSFRSFPPLVSLENAIFCVFDPARHTNDYKMDLKPSENINAVDVSGTN